MNKIFWRIMMLWFAQLSFGQTISFNVKNESGTLIPSSNVLFREKNQSQILEFCRITATSSNYSLQKKYQFLEVEITSAGYQSEKKDVGAINASNNYTVDVVLKPKVTQLKEVVINQADKAYRIKTDTTVFNVDKYRTGNERKVEDLIKKLPGVEVDNNGTIKYKGKQLETVTLDGDNIFGHNYKVGTKNINIDIVEQIEAIENYTNNKLLKGIESEGKVALNLKLKKGKSDFSGNTENALGIKEEKHPSYYGNFYLMQISRNMKSFYTFNANNIGRSDTYFYEKSNAKSMDGKSDEEFKTQQLVSDALFHPNLDPIRYNLNKQWFGSANTLIKLGKSTTFKANLNGIKDEISSLQQTNTTIYDAEVLETKDQNVSKNKPLVGAAELEWRFYTTPHTLLEIYNKQYVEKTDFLNQYTKNDALQLDLNNLTKNYLLINKLVHTWKVLPKHALQGTIYYTHNYIPQWMQSSNDILPLNQTNAFTKDVVLANYNAVGKWSENRYSLQLGTRWDKTAFESNNQSGFVNQDLFKNNSVYGFSKVKFDFDALKVSPSVLITNYQMHLNNAGIGEQNLAKTTVEPSLELYYKKGRSVFRVNYGFSQKPITEEAIYTQKVFVNSRTLNYNVPTLDFKQSQNLSFMYIYSNLARNSELKIGGFYEKSNGQFLQEIQIDKDFTTVKNKFYFQENSMYNANFKAASFLESISSRVEFQSNLNYIRYANIVNQSDIRKNSNFNSNHTFSFTTGFLSKINFDNKSTLNIFKSMSDFFAHENVGFQNKFNLFYRLNSKIRTTLKSDFILPDTSKKDNFHYLDLELLYSYSDKTKFMFLANNLLNKKTFEQISNSDYAVSVSQMQLMPRYFLVTMEYQF